MYAHEPPPPAQMILLLGGFRISQALYAAAVLGVADQTGTPFSIIQATAQ